MAVVAAAVAALRCDIANATGVAVASVAVNGVNSASDLAPSTANAVAARASSAQSAALGCNASAIVANIAAGRRRLAADAGEVADGGHLRRLQAPAPCQALTPISATQLAPFANTSFSVPATSAGSLSAIAAALSSLGTGTSLTTTSAVWGAAVHCATGSFAAVNTVSVQLGALAPAPLATPSQLGLGLGLGLGSAALLVAFVAAVIAMRGGCRCCAAFCPPCCARCCCCCCVVAAVADDDEYDALWVAHAQRPGARLFVAVLLPDVDPASVVAAVTATDIIFTGTCSKNRTYTTEIPLHAAVAVAEPAALVTPDGVQFNLIKAVDEEWPRLMRGQGKHERAAWRPLEVGNGAGADGGANADGVAQAPPGFGAGRGFAVASSGRVIALATPEAAAAAAAAATAAAAKRAL